MLNPDQLTKLSEITNPLVRRRFTVFYQLPPDLQESMLAEGTAESIWNLIKDKYRLPQTSISATARIIGLIFLGEMPIKNFIAALKNELNVDVATAQAIAQDINQAIFQPVRNSLMAVHGLERDTNPPAGGRMSANDANKNTNQSSTIPQQPNSNYEAQQRGEEMLRKIRPPQNNNPPLARPASYTIPRRNVVNLRNIKRKNKYNGFFT